MSSIASRSNRNRRRGAFVIAASVAMAMLPALSAASATPAASTAAPSTVASAHASRDLSTESGSGRGRYELRRRSSLDRVRNPRSGPAPTLRVGDGPFGIGINHRNGSVYIATASGGWVFDGAACNARVPVGCAVTPIAVPGSLGGIGIVMDEVTNTVYVASAGNNAVEVIDASTCNAHVTSGCASPHPAVPVGAFPSHLAIDQHVHTLYVSNEGADAPGGTVSMINTATCNGTVAIGCQTTPPTANTATAPAGLVVEAKTHTLYVSASQAVSLIDTSVCNATNTAGCLSIPPIVAFSGFAVGGALDPVTGSLLVPTFSALGDIASSLEMINTGDCNATNLSGCSQTPNEARIGTGGIDVAVNAFTRRAYVVNEVDSDVSVIDLTRCNALRTDGCRQVAPTMAIGFDGGAVAVDIASNTIYASSQDEGTVTVLDGRACNSSNTSGCRHPAPTTDVGRGTQGGVLDQHTNTLYIANQLANTISVVDPNACAANRLLGCRQTWPTIAVGENPKQLANDEAHDTLYVGDYTGNAVSVVDTITCNSRITSGCGQTPPSIPVSGGAYDIVRDPVTATLYVANVDSDTLTLINTDTCNAHVTSGCGQTPVAVHIGNLPAGLIIDPLTRTLYVSIRGDSNVTVVDMATCNITDTTGCAGTHPTIPINAPPRFLAVDDSTRTLYVSTRNTSTVALVDTATCNAHTASGCPQTPAVVDVGYLPYGVTLDSVNHQVFVGNVGDSTVTAYDSRTCNAHTTIGCNRPMRTIEAGGWPLQVTVDNRNGTLYISDNVDAQVSIVGLVARH
jgi:DNA-binding beta-propeller fold protein YncE